MTIGFRIANGTDLDALFKARTAAGVVPVTGYRDNSSVDINQRYEPRGSTTPIANTGYRISDGTDLAQLFMSISATPTYTFTMTAGTLGGVTGYSDGLAFPDLTGDSISGTTLGVNTIAALTFSSGNTWLVLKHASVNPPNTDDSWISYAVTGIFSNSGGSSVTRTFTRAAATYSTDGPAGNMRGRWMLAGTAASYISGNSYNISIVKN